MTRLGGNDGIKAGMGGGGRIRGVREFLAFDDVLLQPQYSAVAPKDADVATALGRGFSLAMPLLSAAMDTVTEAKMAVAIAQAGGLGVIHKNIPPEQQSAELEKVKRFEGGIVYKPVCIGDDATAADALALQRKHSVSGLPVMMANNRIAGIITHRDLRFETNLSRPVCEVMTPAAKLVSVRPGFRSYEVRALLQKHRIERVVILAANGALKGLVTARDIANSEAFPNASKDAKGRLRAAAAVGANDISRAAMLADAGADALVLDSAHGHSKAVCVAVGKLRKRHPKVLLIAGNVATAAGAKALAEAGADVVKVGIGPGSICTTRIVAGIGIPQLGAIMEVARALKNKKTALIADGGIRYSGDVAKALAAGADAVMIGAVLAGCEEAPGEVELYQGRAYKKYRGMGSESAMRLGSAERYLQNESGKTVPEGIEGRVPFKGAAADVLFQLSGGLRSAMGYVGAKNLAALRRAVFVRITGAGIRESHVHEVQITREAPNYQSE